MTREEKLFSVKDDEIRLIRNGSLCSLSGSRVESSADIDFAFSFVSSALAASQLAEHKIVKDLKL